MNENNDKLKRFLTLGEMMVEYKKRPKTKFLWSGIKEKSFGLIFGPSKSGKTILCEGLAMKIAVGAKDYLGYSLNGKPKKVLFVGLEEHWENRVERNIKQLNHFNENEQELLNQNYRYQHINFAQKIVRKSDWSDLKNTIIQSESEVIFIDSITRINHGNLEDSKTAEEIMQRLRAVCYDLKITLICIHHTPKMKDEILTLNSIKGSSTFAQEADFAIGVNRTSKGHRYVKSVFFRYASDDDDKVKEIEIDDFCNLNYIKESNENEIFQRSDRRRTNNKLDEVVGFFSKQPDTTFSKKDVVKYLTSKLKVKGRMIEYYLKEASDKNLIDTSKYGYYKLKTKNDS